MVVYMNALLDEEIDNVFDFIDCKLAHGVGEGSYYLTARGDCVVHGSPFDGGFETWLEENYDDIELASRDNSYLREEYENNKYEWMESNGITEAEMQTLELLHMQYLAVKTLSKDPENEDIKKEIVDNYELTGINCLRYLMSLKTDEEWRKLGDLQGTQICALFSGYDPKPELDYNGQRSMTLLKMRMELLHNISLIDTLVKEAKKDKEKEEGPKKI